MRRRAPYLIATVLPCTVTLKRTYPRERARQRLFYPGPPGDEHRLVAQGYGAHSILLVTER